MLSKLLINPFVMFQQQSLMASSSSSTTTDTIQCEELMRGGSKSFFAASRVLPKRVRNPSIALYAFCRLMDDIVDEGGDDIGIIQTLQERIDLIYLGQPMDVPADRALATVVAEYKIPSQLHCFPSPSLAKNRIQIRTIRAMPPTCRLNVELDHIVTLNNDRIRWV
jgi:phytoene synthase